MMLSGPASTAKSGSVPGQLADPVDGNFAAPRYPDNREPAAQLGG